MSNLLGELCALLVENAYGDFYSHIFSTLLSHGRSVASTLAQRCQLSLRQIQHGLAVMVQLGLVFYFTTIDGRTSYEANPDNAYHLARSGKVIEYVRLRYGKVAASVITQLLLLGHASVLHLVSASQRPARLRHIQHDAGAEHSACDFLAEPENGHDVEDAVRLLCEHGLVCRLRESHFRTYADTRQVAEDQVGAEFLLTTAKGSKLKDEFAAKVVVEMEKQVDAYIALQKPGLNGIVAQKRKADGIEVGAPNAKQYKLSNGIKIASEITDPNALKPHSNSVLDDKLVVKLNHVRFTKLFRNSRLLALVASTYGGDVSRTYRAILQQLEPALSSMVPATGLVPEKQTSVEISGEVDESRLARDLARPSIPNELEKLQGIDANGYLNDIAEQLSSESCSHLEILCEPPFRFLSRSAENPESYVVNYGGISVQLRNAEILRIISSRFGKCAVRIIRVLSDKGKMDEKNLQELVLMSSKELRQVLAMLHRAGCVELQELPREAQRQPGRTIYLWFYDSDRVRMMLIEDTYKCMARCMQRMKLERKKAMPTIEKSERMDVKDQKEKALSEAELRALNTWCWKEAWLLGELGRLDDLIYVLRDF